MLRLKCPFCDSEEHYVYDVKLCIQFWKGDARASQKKAEREAKKYEAELKKFQGVVDSQYKEIERLKETK